MAEKNPKYNRLKQEKVFHDRWAATINIDGIEVDNTFEGATAPENRFILSRLGDVTGKYLLDLGCGAGENSVYFARKGARCVAGDFSAGMVEVARCLAQRHGVEISARTINAMDIDFSDKTFDIVYAANLLHHVDTKKSLNEIHRVLKPGGVACLWDPLKHNPLINIYRKMATEVRTPVEQPLDIRVVEIFKKMFSNVEYDTFWFATLWIFLRFYLIERVNPNSEPYWKKIIYEEERLRPAYLRLEKLDRMIKRISFIKRFGWNIAIVAKK
jgi:ubiquinone/menaquinone biosynthesis C-methylase UbiE